MSLPSSTDRVSATCGGYIDDFTRLFRFHQISTGKPQDFARLASLLAANEALSSDFYSLVLSILHCEDGGLSETDILTAVAFALGGHDIAGKGEVAIPLDLLSNFTAGLTAWTDGLNNQPDPYDPLDLRPTPPPPSLTPPPAQADAPAAVLAPPSPATDSPSIAAEAADLSAPPLVTELSGTLDRLLLDNLELKHHLEAIERRIGRIEPHLEPSPAATSSQPTQPASQQTALPSVASGIAPSQPPAWPRPRRTASGSFTFAKADDPAHIPVAASEPDAPSVAPPLAPTTASQGPPAGPTPSAAAAPAATPPVSRVAAQSVLPIATSLPIPPATLSSKPAQAAASKAIHQGQSLRTQRPATTPRVTSTLPPSKPYTAPAAKPVTTRSPYIAPDISPDVQRLRAAVIALAVVLLIAIAAAATFAYRFYSTRSPQPLAARIPPPSAAAPPATHAPQSKPLSAPTLRTPSAHEGQLHTQPHVEPPVEEVERESAPGSLIAAPSTTRSANSVRTSTQTTSRSAVASTATPALHLRPSNSTPIAVQPATLASSLPQVSPATPPVVQQHATFPGSPASGPATAPVPKPANPAADSARTTASPILGPVSVPSDVMMRNVLSSQNPVYPPEAKAFRIEGSVIVQIVISKTGAVQAAQAVQGPLQLRLSSVNAVRAWRFRPYLVVGQPVEVNTYIRFNYTAR